MVFIRSLLFALIFYASTVYAVLSTLAVAGLGGDIRPHVSRWARFHRWCCRVIVGIETAEEQSQKKLPPGFNMAPRMR